MSDPKPNPDFVRFQVSCLTGGAIICVRNHEEAQAAERNGAVGIFALNCREEGLEKIFSGCTVHPLVALSEKEEFVEAGIQNLPQAYFTCSPHCTNNPIRDHAFPIFYYNHEFKQGPDQNTSLVILKNYELFAKMRQARAGLEASFPIVGEAKNFEEALAFARAGIDGFFLMYPASRTDMETLQRERLSAPSRFSPTPNKLVVGVLALQGDYLLQKAELEAAAKKLQLPDLFQLELVTRAEDIRQCDGLVLPGGWSNLQSNLFDQLELRQTLLAFHSSGKPILAVCAGMILAGKRAGKDCGNRNMLGFLDVTIDNNILNGVEEVRYGEESFLAMFSNGPCAASVSGEAEVIATAGIRTVGVRERNVVGTAYHKGPGTHDLFLEMVNEDD